MHPVDRRRLACHVYQHMRSLRKTGLLLQVSHTTVRRWLRSPDRKCYDASSRSRASKATRVSAVIRAAVAADPLVTCRRLTRLIHESLGIEISIQLARSVLRAAGLTRKKARFYGAPASLAATTAVFLEAFVSRGARLPLPTRPPWWSQTPKASCSESFGKRRTAWAPSYPF